VLADTGHEAPLAPYTVSNALDDYERDYVRVVARLSIACGTPSMRISSQLSGRSSSMLAGRSAARDPEAALAARVRDRPDRVGEPLFPIYVTR
jgi:hypothetical protein